MRKTKKVLLLLVMTLSLSIAMCVMAFAATTVKCTQTDANKTSVEVTIKVEGTVPSYMCAEISPTTSFVGATRNTMVGGNEKTTYFSNLNPGQVYYVRIGGSAYGTSYSYTTEVLPVVTAPSDVTNLAFVAADDTTATISWSPVAGADGYVVEQYVNGTSIKYTTQATSYKIPMGQGCGSSAYVAPYKKSAYYAAIGNDSYIGGLSALTTKISKNKFGLTAYSSNSTQATIKAVYAGDGYEVEIKPNKGKAIVKSSTISINAKLKKGVMYTYRTRAYVKLSNGKKYYGKWSDSRVMVAPNQQKAQFLGGSNVKLRWKKIAGATKIVVKMSTNRDKGFKTVKTLKGKATSLTISKYKKKSLTRWKTYYYQIHVYNKKGESDIIGTGSFWWH